MNCFKSKNWTIPVIAGLLIFSAACNPFSEKEGCTDPNALNYDSDAEVDDGSCEYPQGQATDTITSDITSDLLLEDKINDPSAVDYLICGNIDIEANLEIEPGVVIELCAGTSLEVQPSGSFKAVGEAGNPIVMRGKTQTPGFWEVIEFNSNNPNNILKFVEISDGGGDSYYNNTTIWVQNTNNAQLTIENTTIRDSKGFGLFAENATSFPGFANNLFKDNGDAGLRVASNHLKELDANTIYNDGNAEVYIHVGTSDLNNDASWPATNAPYLIDGKMDIHAEVDVAPGATFLMAASAGFEVQIDGSFNLEGTATDPITITGETETPGYWNLIEINSNNPNNVFENVEIAYGGGDDYWNYSMIWVQNSNNARFDMRNCTIRQSYGWGLYVESNTNVTPADKASMLSANNFLNNGTGTNANCTGNCNVNDF